MFTLFNSVSVAAQAFGQAASVFTMSAMQAQAQFNDQLCAAAGRLYGAAGKAKIPEDFLEAALREQEGLLGHAFDAFRAQARAASELVHGHYAGLVQAEVLPRSLLQSGALGRTLHSAEATVLGAVDLAEGTRRKLVEPFGVPVAAKKAVAA
jgi:hypothetical protein